jgi:hypothetical protein
MSQKLELGHNYCYFPKSHYTGGKVTGFTNAEVCIVGTRDYIFIVPKREFTSYLVASSIRTFSWGEGLTMEQGLQKMFNDPEMTVSQLEGTLGLILGMEDHDRVIKVSDLKSFKVHMAWIFSQARAKHKAGGATKVITCKGAGNMQRFKDFYFPKEA